MLNHRRRFGKCFGSHFRFRWRLRGNCFAFHGLRNSAISAHVVENIGSQLIEIGVVFDGMITTPATEVIAVFVGKYGYFRIDVIDASFSALLENQQRGRSRGEYRSSQRDVRLRMSEMDWIIGEVGQVRNGRARASLCPTTA